MQDFDTVFRGHGWRSIPGCPGRYVLRPATQASPAELVGGDLRVSEHRVDRARDVVVVARLERGGLISYRRPDGTFVHTLSDADGFARKLAQLGITLTT